MSQFVETWKNNVSYLNMMQLVAQLSRLFSESNIPHIDYRITENLFCKYFNANNLSRSDISYDAQLQNLGVGIKTFQLNDNNSSLEKIAEFNKLSPELRELKGKALALKVSSLRNTRIALADSLCNADQRLYHIIGRKADELVIFNAPYDYINIDSICDVKTSKNNKGISFNDGINDYRYNHSKSVLMKLFSKTDDCVLYPVSIIENPYALLEQLLSSINRESFTVKPFVILPLFSERGGVNVPNSSGLNQWNSKGRKRNYNEVYVSIPAYVRNNYPDFFPPRKVPFNLHLPNGNILSASVCQGGGKALMSNPNKALGEWLLKDVMNVPEGELVTMNKLNELGFDSLMVSKIDENNYDISVSSTTRYLDFKV